jgi:25S rRNA (uracil2634-N3)-methyltransferase
MGKGLKAALKSQQSRLKTKEKLQKATHIAELKGRIPSGDSRSKSKGKEKVQNRLLSNQRPTIPFQPTDKILLIGEGNFSFARALVIDPPPTLGDLPPKNITATAYDTEAECYHKYPEAEEIARVVRDAGVEVVFGVDATKLEKISGFRGRKWDRIVWNFPHAGVYTTCPFCY